MTKQTPLRLTALFLALLVVVTACSDSADTATTTSAAPSTTIDPAQVELAADIRLINDLWSGESAAFVEGVAVGVGYWADNNYPGMGCAHSDYLQNRFPTGPVEGFRLERVVDEPTIVRDDGWAIPGGVLAGQPAAGRVYAMDVVATESTPEGPSDPPAVRTVHVTILDNRAHFFFGC